MKKCGGGWDNANMREEEGCGKDMNTHIYILRAHAWEGKDGGERGTERGREKARMEGRAELRGQTSKHKRRDGRENEGRSFAASARVFCCECGVICLRVRSNSLICVANLIIFHRKLINLRRKFNNLRRKLKFFYISAGKFLYRRR